MEDTVSIYHPMGIQIRGGPAFAQTDRFVYIIRLDSFNSRPTMDEGN